MAQVSIYASADDARLEVNSTPYPVEVLVGGRIVALNLAVGQRVQQGDVLAEIESETDRSQLKEERARKQTALDQLAILRAEIRASDNEIEESSRAGMAALDEARARVEEAEATLAFAREQADRLSRLHSAGLASDADSRRAATNAQQSSSAAAVLRFALVRLQREQQSKEKQQEAQRERLKREEMALEGSVSVAAATIERLERQIQKYQIRAAAGGTVGEVVARQIGSVVREGDRMGTVIPTGELRVLADFTPATALGRIQQGQPAQVRLEGYPWAQFGSLSAKVWSIATQPTNGKVRVELVLDPNRSSPIPLQHGLPGVVEVEVERLSPATLLLRAAGRITGRG